MTFKATREIKHQVQPVNLYPKSISVCNPVHNRINGPEIHCTSAPYLNSTINRSVLDKKLNCFSYNGAVKNSFSGVSLEKRNYSCSMFQ